MANKIPYNLLLNTFTLLTFLSVIDILNEYSLDLRPTNSSIILSLASSLNIPITFLLIPVGIHEG